MDNNEIIRELERRANQLESEAQRLRAAIQVIRGDVPVVSAQPTSNPAPIVVPASPAPRQAVGTMPLIIETLGELGPTSNRDLTAALLERGWTTSSAEPTNTVRTALGRLVQRGQVVQAGRLFSLPSEDETEGDAESDE
jgi:hypothetical protein